MERPLDPRPLDHGAIAHARRLLDGQIDLYLGRAHAAPKAGADVLALMACRGAHDLATGADVRPEDSEALAACSMARARNVLGWLASHWMKRPFGTFEKKNWMAWAPLSLFIAGPSSPNVYGQPDPVAEKPVRKVAKAGAKAPVRKAGRANA
jgi:hypothetical protein